MDKIKKALKKLSKKEKQKIRDILNQINDSNFQNLDLKKLKGRNDVYRVRKGDIRIIFRKVKNNSIKILTIERKNSQTYKK